MDVTLSESVIVAREGLLKLAELENTAFSAFFDEFSITRAISSASCDWSGRLRRRPHTPLYMLRRRVGNLLVYTTRRACPGSHKYVVA